MIFCKNFVTRTRRIIQLDQSVYTQKLLDKFADFLGPPQKTRKSSLPSDASEKIARVEGELSEDDRVYVDNFPYRSLLHAFLYLSMNTRSDIAYAVGLLSRFGAKPTVHTYHLMVYLMQFIRGTVIRFSGSMFDMHVFPDAVCAGKGYFIFETTRLLRKPV